MEYLRAGRAAGLDVDAFAPRLFGDYRFAEKWSFALWALVAQRDRLPELGETFRDKFQRRLDEAAGG